MEIDTGSFRALTARADAVDAIAADMAVVKRHLASQQLAVTGVHEEGYRQGYDDAWMKAITAAGGRHAAPRAARGGSRRGTHLRLVPGPGNRAAGGRR